MNGPFRELDITTVLKMKENATKAQTDSSMKLI